MMGVLQQVNTVAGVLGSFICNDEGGLIERAFPPLYDTPMLEEAACAIADGALALEGPTGGAEMMDFRYSDGRVVVKAMPTCYLVLLCAKDVNLQLLSMTLNVATKKLEKLISARQAQPEPARKAPAAASVSPRLPVVGRGLGLQVQLMKSTQRDTVDSVAISDVSSIQIGGHFRTATFKKVKLTNVATKTSKTFPVRIIKDDNEHMLDGKVMISLAAMRSLGAKEGDMLMAEIDNVAGYGGIQDETLQAMLGVFS